MYSDKKKYSKFLTLACWAGPKFSLTHSLGLMVLAPMMQKERTIRAAIDMLESLVGMVICAVLYKEVNCMDSEGGTWFLYYNPLCKCIHFHICTGCKQTVIYEEQNMECHPTLNREASVAL